MSLPPCPLVTPSLEFRFTLPRVLCVARVLDVFMSAQSEQALPCSVRAVCRHLLQEGGEAAVDIFLLDFLLLPALSHLVLSTEDDSHDYSLGASAAGGGGGWDPQAASYTAWTQGGKETSLATVVWVTWRLFRWASAVSRGGKLDMHSHLSPRARKRQQQEGRRAGLGLLNLAGRRRSIISFQARAADASRFLITPQLLASLLCKQLSISRCACGAADLPPAVSHQQIDQSINVEHQAACAGGAGLAAGLAARGPRADRPPAVRLRPLPPPPARLPRVADGGSPGQPEEQRCQPREAAGGETSSHAPSPLPCNDVCDAYVVIHRARPPPPRPASCGSSWWCR